MRTGRLCLSPYAPSSSPAQKGIVGYSNRSRPAASHAGTTLVRLRKHTTPPAYFLWLTAEPPAETRMHCLRPRTTKTCLAESALKRPTRCRALERRLRSNHEKAWHRPPATAQYSLIATNYGFNDSADWRAAQGKWPPNAKATSNDKAVTNAMPSAKATGGGKPSGLMAFSPQPAQHRQ